jgi:hypothetical protein
MFFTRIFFEMKRLTTISMFKNKLKTGVAGGAEIRVPLIRKKSFKIQLKISHFGGPKNISISALPGLRPVKK